MVPQRGSLFFQPSTIAKLLTDLGRTLAAQGFRNAIPCAEEDQAPGAPRTSFPAVFPPSIGKSPPVHDALASEARNATR